MSVTEPDRARPDVAPTSRRIFISFASSDLDLARRVVEGLERSGLRCWISDRDIEPATSYPAAITAAVKNSGAVLLLLTSASNGSPHVLREIELAFNARRPLLPVRIAGVTPSSDMQYFLSTTQWLDAGAAFDDADLARVEPKLRELLGSRRGGRGETAGDRRWLPIVGTAAALLTVALVAVAFWSERREGVAGPPASPTADARLTPAQEPAPTPQPSLTDPQGAAISPIGRPASSGVTLKVNPRDKQAYAWVAPGQFLMGCSTGDPDCDDDEKPVHMVEIPRGFWLSRTEVTNGQFRTATPARDSGESGDSNLPAGGVSWALAKAYCSGVGGRLPTEAEWEFAARGGSSTRYYDTLAAIAWFADNSDEHPHPVGTKAPNAFGLHDMLGNVAEWVRDRYYNAYDDTSDTTQVEEPLADNASGVARGGSWVSEPAGVRVSRRLGMPPDAEEPFIGFRCAMDRL